MQLEDIKEQMEQHEKNDDKRFYEISETLKDIRDFTVEIRGIIFPKSGSVPPLQQLQSHEVSIQRMKGGMYVLVTLVTSGIIWEIIKAINK